jgi:hypothetical protein
MSSNLSPPPRRNRRFLKRKSLGEKTGRERRNLGGKNNLMGVNGLVE